MNEKNIKKGQENQLKKLSNRHRRCIDLMVAGEIPTDRQIAAVLGVAPETLSRWKNSDVFREELEKRIDEEERYRRLRYRAKANYAAEELFSAMDSTHPVVSLKAIFKVLELAGDYTKNSEVKPAGESFGVVIIPEMKAGPKGNG